MRVPLGKVRPTPGSNAIGSGFLSAVVSVVWIERLGILHWETALETSNSTHQNAFADIICDQAEVVPHVFDATRKAVTICDALVARFKERAAKVEGFEPHEA